MIGLDHFVHTSLAKTIGWALFHSLWQGALVGLLLLALLLVLRAPRTRYASACAALAATAAAFVFTLLLLALRDGGAAAAAPLLLPGATAARSGSSAALAPAFQAEEALPWLAPLWFAGVVVFQLRAMAGWITVRRLRSRGVCRPPDPWPERVRQLGIRLGVARPVALWETCLAETPVVIGYLRPVILAPVGMLAAMPPSQVEAILLHELAHIQRRDYLVNLLQTVVESILFYHPAVWWISSVIRAERENCCDDAAVAAGCGALNYAAALTGLEQTRRAAHQTALAASGGSLVKRIRRLLRPPQGPAWAPFWSAAILTAAAVGVLLGWQSSQVGQNPLPVPSQHVSPYARWLDEEVVYIIDPRERAAFESLRSDQERNRFIEQFWLRRDPTPGTPENEFKEEHYRRIAYANKRFAWNVPGWKTDRGRIYILFGPPDEIESHRSGEVGRGNYPFEQWLYHHLKGIGDNVLIDFADEAKTGDYKMTKDPHPTGGRFVRP